VPDRDSASFEAAYRKYRKRISGRAIGYEASPTEREDLLQSAWLSAWSTWHTAPEGDDVLPWLLTTLKRAWITRIVRSGARKRCHESVSFDVMPESFHAGVPADQETMSELKRVVRAIDRLPAPQREAVTMSALGYFESEIGDRFGISRQAAHKRLLHARKNLRLTVARNQLNSD
jgi:RNA polymerase sigma factor (sigma-70 family)